MSNLRLARVDDAFTPGAGVATALDTFALTDRRLCLSGWTTFDEAELIACDGPIPSGGDRPFARHALPMNAQALWLRSDGVVE